MTNDLTTTAANPLGLAHAKLTPTALTFDEGCSFADWQTAFRQLSTMQGALAWWIGDALNFGENRYGEKYAQAVEATGYKETYLKNCCWVSERVEKSLRSDFLSHAHHQIVAPLEPQAQKKWLAAAKEHGLSCRALRYSIANGRILTDEDCDRISGKGSGIKGLLEGIMRDFRGWLKRETNDDPDEVEKWDIKRVEVVWHELRPAYILANKCAGILSREQAKQKKEAKPATA
jgi:hypothetical protein